MRYASLGWHLYPLGYRAKVPLRGTHGVRGAIADAQVWRRYPYAGIALACGPSRIVVLDGDTRHGARLDDAVAAFGPEILDTVRQRSGGGGWHLFFQAPPGLDIRSLHLTNPLGWELIGRGFGVALYPSVHPSGRRYLWERAPWQVSVLPLPAPLVQAAYQAMQAGPTSSAAGPIPQSPHTLGDPPTIAALPAEAAIDQAAELVAKAPDGKRNTTLFAAARHLGSLAAAGKVAVSTVKAQLAEAATQAGLGERETYHTIQSGMAIGAKYPYEEGEPL